MKFYITTNALTKGIEEVEARDPLSLGCLDLLYHVEGVNLEMVAGPGDWYRTREKAKVRADVMRYNKVVSLKEQIAKLEQLDFSAKGSA